MNTNPFVGDMRFSSLELCTDHLAKLHGVLEGISHHAARSASSHSPPSVQNKLVCQICKYSVGHARDSVCTHKGCMEALSTKEITLLPKTARPHLSQHLWPQRALTKPYPPHQSAGIPKKGNVKELSPILILGSTAQCPHTTPRTDCHVFLPGTTAHLVPHHELQPLISHHEVVHDERIYQASRCRLP
ncbi:hypothetical protein TNIN_104811 [Trichonephila inaurata madagascariensis]|uniref:Uncharacterized protein n=1 Tax=Trichonephila inaurata madagascariensis TaxID=2747483 RepID=A0A8X6X6E6_9ARAC|nr:hypothetical protein TNIN_104811 [Trichonephila inaurata madagascariensis]